MERLKIKLKIRLFSISMTYQRIQRLIQIAVILCPEGTNENSPGRSPRVKNG
jgi:hypothetical protein